MQTNLHRSTRLRWSQCGASLPTISPVSLHFLNSHQRATLRAHVSPAGAIGPRFAIVSHHLRPNTLYPDYCHPERCPAMNDRALYPVCLEFCQPRCHPRLLARRFEFEYPDSGARTAENGESLLVVTAFAAARLELCRSFGKDSKSIWESGESVSCSNSKNGLASFPKITADLST